MTTQVCAYLTFNGNCREAMQFYQHCLGGELALQTIGESPMAENIPEEMKGCILQATLTNESLVFMASDMVGNQGLKKGNSVSLMLNCSSETELREKYRLLADGGVETHPLQETFWGSLFGDLTDKFGNQWLLNLVV